MIGSRSASSSAQFLADPADSLPSSRAPSAPNTMPESRVACRAMSSVSSPASAAAVSA
ncbi:Uncharacterised protein [Mycobacteroides abscessus subsp. abscessus]|nr:Uncharacterised protein [Mycobacteroides abscessus subsp. abscessus]